MNLFDDVQKTNRGASVIVAPGQEAGILRAYGLDKFAQMITVVLSVIDIDRVTFVSNPLLQLSAIIR